MAVQRKTFRIEECARASRRAPAPADEPDGALRREFMAELRALRELMQPRHALDRKTMERARAQIVEAQAYKQELETIHAAVRRTREAMQSPGASWVDGVRTGRELEAIVTDTERATRTILEAVEDIDRAASALSVTLRNPYEQGLSLDIRDRVLKVFEACNFQDLTGQRVARVVATLMHIETQTARLMEIWRDIERFQPVAIGEAADCDGRFLNGPKLDGDPGHAGQEEVDAIFGCA